jgi:hypothetical protein
MKNKIKNEWTLAEGREEGKRLMVRLNESVRRMIGDEQYCFRVDIEVPFKSPNADGTPKVDEFQHLDALEDLILDRFKANHTGVLCIIVTMPGRQRFAVYSTTDDISQIMEDIALHFPKYKVQHSVELDKNWDEYRRWVAELGE